MGQNAYSPLEFEENVLLYHIWQLHYKEAALPHIVVIILFMMLSQFSFIEHR
jgi:hypothetical protein